MRFVRILINFTFLIIANAMLPFDDQGSTENSGSDNLNPFNSDSAAISDNFYADHNVAPEQENVQSINYLNPDIAGGKGDSISISDSGKCASNLGKREDNGFTSAGAGGCLPSSKPESDDTLLLPNSIPNSILKLPKIKLPDAIQDFLERQRRTMPFLFGPPNPKKPDCETWQELVCCTYENSDEYPLLGIHVEDCGSWFDWRCHIGMYCCDKVYNKAIDVSHSSDPTKPKYIITLAGDRCTRMYDFQ